MMSGEKAKLKILLTRNNEEVESVELDGNHDFLQRSLSHFQDWAKSGKEVVEWINVPISVMFPQLGNMIDKVLSYAPDKDDEAGDARNNKNKNSHIDPDFYAALTQLATCVNSGNDIRDQAHAMSVLSKAIEDMPPSHTKNNGTATE